MQLPRTVVYVDETEHPFYAPQNFKAERSFVLYPHESALIILNQHNNLECYSRKLRDGARSLSWRYFSGDKLGIVVKNVSKPGAGTNLFVRQFAPLNELLRLSTVRSHWAILDKEFFDTLAIPKKNNKRAWSHHHHPPAKKMKKEEGTESCECFLSSEENYDDDDDDDNSCTESCDHSDIDDTDLSKNDDNDNEVLVLN